MIQFVLEKDLLYKEEITYFSVVHQLTCPEMLQLSSCSENLENQQFLSPNVQLVGDK